MRLIVNHGDFPFARDTRLARVVDVTLLVLLAAVVVQAVARHAPPPPPPSPASTSVAADVTRQVILSMHADGRWTLDGQLVPASDLQRALLRAFADRKVKVLFIAPARTVSLADVQAAAATARAAGIRTVGVLPAR